MRSALVDQLRGTALLQAIPALDALQLEGDEAVGISILRRALEAPVRESSSVRCQPPSG